MNFCRKHSSYSKAATVQAKVAVWNAELLPRIPKLEGKVLELGAGTGLFTKHLSKQFPQLVASDLSKEMVEEGRVALPEVSWRVFDAWSIPQDLQVTGLFSSSLLQWATHPMQVLSNWNAALDSGAWMLHSFFTDGSLRELKQVSPESLAVEFRPVDEWAQIFQEAGFEILDQAEREDVLHFDSALGFFRNLHDLGTTSQNKFSSTQLRKVLKEYEATFSSKPGVSAHWNTARILCQKSQG